MHRLLISKKNLIACLFFLLSLKGVYGQTVEKEIYKKYVLKDSSGIYKSAILLFYKDNTFINFGILDNKKELDLYVWYKAGTWSEKDSRIECIANEKLTPVEDLKKSIKYHYRRHRDRVLIENYYEFVHETYLNGTLQVGPENASDNDKKIEYSEIKF